MSNELWPHIQGELDEAAERLHLDAGMHRVLRVPKRELTVNFPVTHDDGRVEVYTGYRVHHNVNRGPTSRKPQNSATAAISRSMSSGRDSR